MLFSMKNVIFFYPRPNEIREFRFEKDKFGKRTKTIFKDVMIGPEEAERGLLVRSNIVTPSFLLDFGREPADDRKRVLYQKALVRAKQPQLAVTKWAELTLPLAQPCSLSRLHISVRPDGYRYDPPADPRDVDWHVDFADADTFYGYSGSLFAQEEIMVAEHPELHAIREYLISASKISEIHYPTCMDQRLQVATPILVKGAQRCLSINASADSATNRPCIYGQRFGQAGIGTVMRSTTVIDPPTITNVIAMCALLNGDGEYKETEIAYHLRTAYTAFSAAKHESGSGSAWINSGNWGCGAFGGNKALMATIQFIAADLAGIDGFVYHAFDYESAIVANEALGKLRAYLTSRPRVLAEVIDHLCAQKFRWGSSDGN